MAPGGRLTVFRTLRVDLDTEAPARRRYRELAGEEEDDDLLPSLEAAQAVRFLRIRQACTSDPTRKLRLAEPSASVSPLLKRAPSP